MYYEEETHTLEVLDGFYDPTIQNTALLFIMATTKDGK